MVHSKTSNQCWANNGSGEFPPGVTSPMQQAADKINDKLCGDEADNDRRRADVILKSGLDEFPPKPKRESHVCAFEGTLGVGVMIIPEIVFGG